MSFFESLLALLFVAVVLLQVARRASLPYPAMLALAGVGVAFIPGAPMIRIEPQTALALFIAPVLLDAAYDFPIRQAKVLWRPLLVLAGGVVLLTTLAVAWIGWSVAGLPLAAALVLGAIVAPSDAAAAVAVLGSVSMPRRTISVLKGESLFNDAVALLLFQAALTVQSSGGLHAGEAWRLALAAPGGVVFGVVCGHLMGRVGRFVGNTLGANLLQFLNTFLIWVVAERLHLSAVLAVVACAMTVSGVVERRNSARMRVHSLAVWASVVFVLNVLAFLLMGMQARMILERMPPDRLWQAAWVVGLVVAAIVGARFAVVLVWTRLAAWFPGLRGGESAPTFGQSVVVAWSGMRGLVTLAAAFALPSGFPQRDLVVLAAFGVVLATLVVQGLTLAPLIRALGVDRLEDRDADLVSARRALMHVGLERIEAGEGADMALGDIYRMKRQAPPDAGIPDTVQRHRDLGLAVVAAQRAELRRLREADALDMEDFYLLQEEMDWRELTLLPDEERRIAEV